MYILTSNTYIFIWPQNHMFISSRAYIAERIYIHSCMCTHMHACTHSYRTKLATTQHIFPLTDCWLDRFDSLATNGTVLCNLYFVRTCVQKNSAVVWTIYTYVTAYTYVTEPSVHEAHVNEAVVCVCVWERERERECANLSVCMCMCSCACGCMCMCMCMCMYACVCLCVRLCMCVCECACVFMRWCNICMVWRVYVKFLRSYTWVPFSNLHPTCYDAYLCQHLCAFALTFSHLDFFGTFATEYFMATRYQHLMCVYVYYIYVCKRICVYIFI